MRFTGGIIYVLVVYGYVLSEITQEKKDFEGGGCPLVDWVFISCYTLYKKLLYICVMALYTLRVGEKLLDALKEAGSERVRGVLCDGFGVEQEEVRLGRPKRNTETETVVRNTDKKKAVIRKEPVIQLEKSNTVPPVPKWVADAAARIERKQAASKAKQAVNHDPPVEEPPVETVDAPEDVPEY